MLKTVEAIMNPGGIFKLEEPVEIKRPQRVLITLLDEKTGAQKEEESNTQIERQRTERLNLSGIFESSQTDISQNVDKYIYE